MRWRRPQAIVAWAGRSPFPARGVGELTDRHPPCRVWEAREGAPSPHPDPGSCAAGNRGRCNHDHPAWRPTPSSCRCATSRRPS